MISTRKLKRVKQQCIDYSNTKFKHKQSQSGNKGIDDNLNLHWKTTELPQKCAGYKQNMSQM